MFTSLLKRTYILLLGFSISAITWPSHAISDARPPSLEMVVQEKLKTALNLTNLQISFKNILHSKEPALMSDRMRDRSTAIFVMRNHQWYQLELNPLDRLFGFNIGQRFPRNTLLDNRGFFGIFSHFSISSHLIGGRYYKKLIRGFGVEASGSFHKWTIGLAQRERWQSSNTIDTMVDWTSHFHMASYYFTQKGKLGCINPFVFGALIQSDDKVAPVLEIGGGLKWELPNYCSLSIYGKIVEKDTIKYAWKPIWSITVDYLPFKAESLKRERLQGYALYSKPDIQLPNAFRDLIVFSEVKRTDDDALFSKILEQTGLFISYDRENLRSFLEQQIRDKHYRIASALVDKVPESILMKTQERKDGPLALVIRQLYFKDSMPIFDENHFNFFKKLLEEGVDHMVYAFSLPVQGGFPPSSNMGEDLMRRYHNIYAQYYVEKEKEPQDSLALEMTHKDYKRVLTIFPSYIAELILSGMSPPFHKDEKLQNRVMNYVLQKNTAHLFPSVVNSYRELKSELLFRVDDNLKEQEYLSSCLFYKPFIKRYIKEYKMIQQTFPEFGPDSEKRIFLPNQWYRTTQSERANLINIAIKCRMFKQCLLPVEIHDMIESEVLKKGMIEYLKRIKTSSAFLFPDELPDLPEEPLMKFFISSLFLKNDNLSQKFNMIETKAVSLWGVSTPIVETK